MFPFFFNKVFTMWDVVLRFESSATVKSLLASLRWIIIPIECTKYDIFS